MMLISPQERQECRRLLTLGTPIVVGQLGVTVQGVVDTVMLGRYSSHALAAAGFVNSVLLFASVVVMGFAVGVIPLCGAAYGRGDKERCGAVLRWALSAITLFGLLATALLCLLFLHIDALGQPAELRAEMLGYFWTVIPSFLVLAWCSTLKSFFDSLTLTRVAMWAILTGNLWNVVWNFLLIYGLCGLPRLGVVGAGLATASSRVVILLFYVWMLCRSAGMRPYVAALRRARTGWRELRGLCAMGLPIALQSGFEVGSFSACSLIAGWIGAQALAAHQVLISLTGTIWIVYFGLATATSVRVASQMGQADLRAVDFTARCSLKLILCAAVVMNVLFLSLSGTLFGWFTADRTVLALLPSALLPIVLYQFGDALQTNYVNVLRGMGHVRYLALDSFLSYVVVGIPLSYVLGVVLQGGLRGVWMSFPVSLSVAAALYIWRYRRASRAGRSPQR